MSTSDTLLRFLETSDNFFSAAGGAVRRLEHGTRRNIEVLDSRRHPEIAFCSLDVEFSEAAKFGTGGFSDAYDRYRCMRSAWWGELTKNGLGVWSPEMSVVGHFVPLLADDCHPGTPYPRQAQPSYGSRLTPVSDLEGINPYYEEARRRYDIEWLLADEQGIVIGPDLGLLYSVMAAAQTGPADILADIGAGTGELSASVLRKVTECRGIVLAEFSPYLCQHLGSYLDPIASAQGVAIDYQFVNAVEMVLPPRVDIASIGIYYGAQPPFFAARGAQLRKALTDEGIVLIQSGMIEGSFNIGMVTGRDRRFRKWGWFDDALTIPSYFEYTSTFVVAGEVITAAARSARPVERLKTQLERDGLYAEVPVLPAIDCELRKTPSTWQKHFA